MTQKLASFIFFNELCTCYLNLHYAQFYNFTCIIKIFIVPLRRICFHNALILVHYRND